MVIPGKFRTFNKFNAILNALFLPYQVMKKYPGCEYLVGRQYLLPVAWLHRFVHLLTRKGKLSPNRIEILNSIDKTELDDRYELLSKMGLIM